MRSAVLAAGSSLLTFIPRPSAWAAAPSSHGPASPSSTLVLADPQLLPLMPGPISFPRRQLENNFAVLLLRSGYDALDDLDFVGMVGGKEEGGEQRGCGYACNVAIACCVGLH